MFKVFCIVLLIVLLVALPLWGYVANIVKLCLCDFDVPLKAEIIRSIGIIVPPIGVVAGFCTIADGKPDPNSN